MKYVKLTIICILFCKTGVCQSIETRKIAVVHESLKVDSIIDDFKKSNERSVYKNDSCFLLDVVQLPNKMFSMTVSFISTNNSLVLSGDEKLLDKPNLRCFRLRNNLIFVTGVIHVDDLFVKTTRTGFFSFKHLPPNDKPTKKGLYSITYRYVNGHFISFYSDENH